MAYYFEKPDVRGSLSMVTLTASDSAQSPEPKGSIQLDGCVMQIADKELRRKCTFAIYHQSRRTFYVQATSKEERDQWMTAMAELAEQQVSLSDLEM